jgi:hypothetical protein
LQTFHNIEVKIPESILRFTTADLFELETSTDPDALEKYLFYMPEVVRSYGVVVAELKRRKNIREFELEVRESAIMAELSSPMNSHRYKNEHSRLAAVRKDEEYQAIRNDMIEIESDIAVSQELMFKFKNLLSSLYNITQLRVSERKV